MSICTYTSLSLSLPLHIDTWKKEKITYTFESVTLDTNHDYEEKWIRSTIIECVIIIVRVILPFQFFIFFDVYFIINDDENEAINRQMFYSNVQHLLDALLSVWTEDCDADVWFCICA